MKLSDLIKGAQNEMNQYGEKLSVDGDAGPKTNAALSKFSLLGVQLSKNEELPTPQDPISEPYTGPMRKVCQALNAPKVKGIDISGWQGAIDWNKATNQGDIDFAFIKASEGSTIKDKMFLRHWDAANEAGVLTGAYHFFRMSTSGKQQAKFFSDIINPKRGLSLQLPPVMDWEAHDGNPSDNDVEQGLEFLHEVVRLTGAKPIIYTGPYFFKSLGSKALQNDLHKYALWIANYGVTCPLVPPPWQKWSFWQYTDKLIIPGYSSGVDGNYFDGTLDELKAMCV